MYSSFSVCIFCMCESLSLCKMYYVCVCVCTIYMLGTLRDQKRALDSVELELLWTTVWVLGTGSGPSERVTCKCSLLLSYHLSIFLKIILHNTFNVFVHESLMVGNFDIITLLPQRFIILDLKIVNPHTFYMILWVKSWEREFNMLSSIHYRVFQNLLS